MWNPEMGPIPADLAKPGNFGIRTGANEHTEQHVDSLENTGTDNGGEPHSDNSSKSTEAETTPEEETSREELKPNDLIVPDHHAKSAMKVLKNACIPCRVD